MKKDSKISLFENIADAGITQTLRALSKMTGRSWSIFSKGKEFLDIEKAWKLFPFDNEIEFGGELNVCGEIGVSLLCIFPQKSVLNLTNFINVKADSNSKQSAIQKMTVAEVSNVLSNSFLGVVANTLKTSLLPGQPAVSVGSKGYLLKKAVSKSKIKSGYVLTRKLLMQSDYLTMNASFVVILSKNSLEKLVNQLHRSENNLQQP
jgi:chemotaxis protein CheY-P-specific phosphatase CheC